ncbi:MAG: dihydrofolate reductase [Ignavibacteriales bacterium]
MKAIAAVDLNWGIGYQGNLLAHIPDDMKFFKQTTLNKVVVMGRETFESLPGKQPLKERINIVLSKSATFDDEHIIVCHSLEELFIELKKYPADDIFVIGGESIYSQLLPYCNEVFITKIEKSYQADKYFINLDENKSWKPVYESEIQNYKDVKYKFIKYVNCKY